MNIPLLAHGNTIHKPEKKWPRWKTYLFVLVFNAVMWTGIVIGIARSLG